MFSAMVRSSFDVSISARATPERRRALISKSSRATVPSARAGSRARAASPTRRSAGRRRPRLVPGSAPRPAPRCRRRPEAPSMTGDALGVDVARAAAAGLVGDRDGAARWHTAHAVAEAQRRAVVLVDGDHEVPSFGRESRKLSTSVNPPCARRDDGRVVEVRGEVEMQLEVGEPARVEVACAPSSSPPARQRAEDRRRPQR